MNKSLDVRERDFLLMRSSEGYMRIENNRITLVNHSLLQILGYHHQDELPDFFPEIVYHQREFLKYSAALINNCSVSHYDLSLKGCHGEEVTVRCEASSVVDDDQVVVFLLLEDITIQHKRLEELMLKSTVFEHNPFSVAITDHQGVVDVINRRFKRRTGFNDKLIAGVNIFDLKTITSPLSGLNREDILDEIERRPEFVGEFRSVKQDGSTFMEELHIVPVYRNGELKNIIFISYDLTDERAIRRKLEDLAYHDQMTGLLRKEPFYEIAEEIKINIDEEKRSMGLLFIDLDNFKPINDSYGHRIGDMVLVECAALLRNLFRRTDVVARFGGDEFVAICPNVPRIEDMEIICEKIAATFNASALALTAENIDVSISVGACFYSGETDSHMSLGDLVHAADKNMYQAKRESDAGYQLAPLNLLTPS
jgi:diguanylate cyclase (GGDEF)-like protein/PAS domain S-box-containing protein